MKKLTARLAHLRPTPKPHNDLLRAGQYAPTSGYSYGENVALFDRIAAGVSL